LFPVAQTNCNISRILEKVYFLLPALSGWWTLEGNEDLKQIGNLLRNFDDKSLSDHDICHSVKRQFSEDN